MNKDIETLIKIQDKINRRRYHLHVDTDLQEKFRFLLFINFNDERDYFSTLNFPILSTRDGDTVEDLMKYLEKHDGFNEMW